MSSSEPWKSASEPLDAPAGTNWLPPPPSPPPSRPPRNWTAVGDDLDRLALGAVLRVPLAPLEAAVDRDRAALGEVLRAALSLVAPDRDVEVVRLLGPLAGRLSLRRVLTAMRRLQTAMPRRRLAQLGVAGQVADQDDAIDVGAMTLRSSPSGRSRLLRAAVGVIVGPGRGAAGVATGTCDGAFVWPSLTRRKAPWRTTPSVILSTRTISASVSAGAVKSRRW